MGAVRCRTVVTGAAPAWIGDRLNAEPHEGRIVHAGSDAVYFTSDYDVIGVTSRHATSIPCAVATRLERLEELFDGERLPPIGGAISLGAGAARLAGTDIRIGRFLNFQMRPFSLDAAPQMRARLTELLGVPASEELSEKDLTGLSHHPAAALPSVLGKGTGLTPFGDDVVCGLLATLLAAGVPGARDLRERALELAAARTTPLSATLLRRAGAGDVLPAFARVVSDLSTGSDRLTASVSNLRAIGHTSGAGMLLGLHLGLTHITTRSCS